MDDIPAVVCGQNFLLKVFFAPILITSDSIKAKVEFNYLKAYKPDRITFGKSVKGEVDIKFSDPVYKHFKTDMTLKGLTDVQIEQLEKIKSWVG